ncbi:MAG: hypothetical protein F4206_04425 [Gammaproteobacteria bacterium]|nr:hypothetical protein [Gammaproteobacteria bacterium]MYG65963.1 hypothetical protein [Gammaproteobacteria bacterium]
MKVHDDGRTASIEVVIPVKLTIDQFVFDFRTVAQFHLEDIARVVHLDVLPAWGMDIPLG